MEYCEGDTLRNFIDEKPLAKESEDQVWKIFCQIIEALSYLHNSGLIHRDLKPMNVFLDKAKNVKLGDFGLTVSH